MDPSYYLRSAFSSFWEQIPKDRVDVNHMSLDMDVNIDTADLSRVSRAERIA